MNETTASDIFFYETNLCPQYLRNRCSMDKSVINATSIVTGKSWSELVRSLIEQAHIRGNMPTYKTCLTDLLRANGFVPLGNIYSLKDTLQAVNQVYAYDKKYIVKMGANNYCALVPDSCKKQYVIKGTVTGKTPIERRWIEEIWLYIPGTDNRTGIKRRSKEKTMPSESNEFTAKNMNPEGRRIGDCVIRALSAAYDCTWHDAIDYIADATQYNDPVLNSTSNINTTLIKLGFERHKGVKKGNKFINGKELCSILDSTYHNGETIFAYVGRSHCAAILPIHENGITRYKVQDTWDSTSRGISEYWVYKKTVIDSQTAKDTYASRVQRFKIGEWVNHPIYGKGKVTYITGEGINRFLEIHFASGSRRISETWLAKNS